MKPIPARRPLLQPGRLLSVSTVPGTGSGRVVVEVIGEIDTYTAPALEDCLHRLIQRGLSVLIVDLAQVDFLSAAGVTVLARAHRRCDMRGARLVVRSGGQRPVLRPLQLTGFTDMVAVDPADLERLLQRGSPIPMRTPDGSVDSGSQASVTAGPAQLRCQVMAPR